MPEILSKDEFLLRYVPRDPENPTLVQHGKTVHDDIEICLRYAEGGTSVWTGENHRRGLKLQIWPVERDGPMVTRMLFDPNGMTFHVTDLARRNDRRSEAVAAIVGRHVDAITVAARRQDWPAIKAVVDVVRAEISA